ncbi:unnamed protein product [Oncorhynchus mykiss]|uniref:Uncharacterized protein n=1 Tax=Oncorhynchus mykiss TaxID=8022 RepID=A0A060W5G7_ONCMY|nr:unnamed protein product [Oncorhynchus mykiss]
MEEFGSPELRRRLAAYSPDRSPSLPRYYQQQPRCQSWGGSPVLPRGARTLPINAHLIDSDRNRGLNGLPRSPASHQLSVQARQSYYNFTMSPSSVSCHHGVQNHRLWLGDESPRLSSKCGDHSPRLACKFGDESPRLSSKFRPPLPAGRPTAIQHEIPASMITSTPTSCDQRASSYTSHRTPSDSPCLPNKVNSKQSGQSNDSKLGEGLNQTSDRRSNSPATSPHMAHKLAEDATKLSTIFMDRGTPSPTLSQANSTRSESPTSGYISRESQPYATLHGQGSPAQPHPEANTHTHLQDHRWTDKEFLRAGPHSRESRPGQGQGQASPLLLQKGTSSPAMPATLHLVVASHTPIIDPRLQRAELLMKDSPTLHRHQPPQYMGDRGSPSLERRPYDTRFDRGGPRDNPESSRRLIIGLDMEPPESWSSRMQQWRENGSVADREESYSESPTADGDEVYVVTKEELQQRRNGAAVLGYQGYKHGVNREQRGETQDHSGALGSSQSSSGVTGSLGESTQPERDCLSPETSSQSSQKSNDTEETASGMQVCVCVKYIYIFLKYTYRPLLSATSDSDCLPLCLSEE